MISEWVRERVVERLGLDPDRVHAIHLGVDHDRFTPDPAVEREPFLYYPARPWPHKNHAAAVRGVRVAAARAARAAARADRGRATTRCACPAGVEALGDAGLETRDLALPPRRARSSSRASTRASGCRRSRRWHAAARSPPRARGRCRRSSATRPCSSTRTTPPRSPPASTEALARADELAERGTGAGSAVHVGRDGARPRPRLRARDARL